MIYFTSSMPLVVKLERLFYFMGSKFERRGYHNLLVVNKVHSSRELFLQWILQWRWHLRQILYPIINVEEKRNVDNTGNRHRMVCHKIAKKEEGREAKAAFYDFHINALQLQRETVWYIGNGATFESASSILHSHYLASTHVTYVCIWWYIYMPNGFIDIYLILISYLFSYVTWCNMIFLKVNTFSKEFMS